MTSPSTKIPLSATAELFNATLALACDVAAGSKPLMLARGVSSDALAELDMDIAELCAQLSDPGLVLSGASDSLLESVLWHRELKVTDDVFTFPKFDRYTVTAWAPSVPHTVDAPVQHDVDVEDVADVDVVWLTGEIASRNEVRPNAMTSVFVPLMHHPLGALSRLELSSLNAANALELALMYTQLRAAGVPWLLAHDAVIRI